MTRRVRSARLQPSPSSAYLSEVTCPDSIFQSPSRGSDYYHDNAKTQLTQHFPSYFEFLRISPILM